MLSTLLRLLTPTKAAKFHYSFWMIGNLYDVSMGILEPIFTAWILSTIIAKDIHGLYLAVALFACVKLLQQILAFCMEFSKSRTINAAEIEIQNIFFRKFIRFENTKAELYGTGKIMNVATK